MKKPILIIMARAPRFGAVKTRLAKDLGQLPAWRFYVNTLRESLRRLTKKDHWDIWLHVTPDRERRALGQWPASAGLLPQGRGGLGKKMERGLTAFSRGTPVVLIGSDIPGITTNHILRAFKALEWADIALGPATDGGYWLVGFSNRRPSYRPFNNVRWSTSQALADTLNGFANRRVALVDCMRDIDNGESYNQLAQAYRARVELQSSKNVVTNQGPYRQKRISS
ncbi:MAG: TIGR04282 family arsenosugar biosynthesis glycosyltransferase [Rhodospirillaceae bacterium]